VFPDIVNSKGNIHKNWEVFTPRAPSRFCKNFLISGHFVQWKLNWPSANFQGLWGLYKSNALLQAGGYIDSGSLKCKQQPGGSFTQFITQHSRQPASQPASPHPLSHHCHRLLSATALYDKSGIQPSYHIYCVWIQPLVM
jgi:hypothetical protein